MRNSVILSTATIALVGCAMTQPISPADNAAIRGKKVALTTWGTPSFAAVTVANSMVGAHTFAQSIGELIALREGNKIIMENKVKDPALQISEGLAKSLQAKYSTQTLAQIFDMPSKEDFALIRKTADYQLAVRTTEWEVLHYASVTYSAHASLINTKTKATVAKSVCTMTRNVESSQKTYEALVANQAASLKKILHQLGEECTTRLQKAMFE